MIFKITYIKHEKYIHCLYNSIDKKHMSITRTYVYKIIIHKRTYISVHA